MAARVNTKFVLILFIVVAIVFGVVAGIWFFKIRTDVSRSIARGDELMQEGDPRLARTSYSRAVGKDPANAEYIAKLRGALESIRPDTADEASELYRAYISLLKHDAAHHPLDAEKHLALLRELRKAARRSSAWWYWELVEEAADYMLARLPDSDPKKSFGKLYLGEARVNARMADRLSEDEINEGEVALREFVAANPNSDDGWAALVLGQLVVAERMHALSLTTQETQQRQRLETTLAEALQKVPEGPQVLIASLRVVLYRFLLHQEPVDEAAVARDTTRLVELIADSDDAWLVGEVAEILDRYRWIEDAPRPLIVVDQFLAKHPDALGHRLIKARLHSYRGELEMAEEAIQAILDAEPLHVGYVSQLQGELRRRAASLNVDIAVSRWEAADPEQRPAQLENIMKTRNALEALVTDLENDPLLLRANGKIAFAHQNYSEATAIFERLAREQTAVDFETLMYAAVSLEQRGEIGAAAQRVEEALVLRPGNNAARLHEARLRTRMGQYEKARALVEAVLTIDPQYEGASDLKLEITRRLDPDRALAQDPVLGAIDAAQAAVAAGEFDTARSTIAAARTKAPDDLRLLNALIRVEMTAGRTEEARALLTIGLERAPDSTTFLTLKSFLENPDPIQRVTYFVNATIDQELDRTLELLHSMRILATRNKAEARRLEAGGNTDDAAVARDIEKRALAEMAGYKAKAAEIAPENARYVEFLFLEAIDNQDWDGVERAIAEATRLNSDQAGGALYQGRYQAVRNNAREAARAFALAAERVPYSAFAWRLLAVSHQRLGNVDESLKAFERAYANNPNDAGTILGYGSVLLATQNYQRAVSIFREGRRIAPNNVQIRDAWLNSERLVGNGRVTLHERRRLYKEDPSDLRNAAALAAMLGTTTPIRELLIDEDGKERYTIERWGRLPIQGEDSGESILAREQTKWYDEADAIVEKLAAPEERDLGWVVLRADLLRARGAIDESIAMIGNYAAGLEANDDKFQAILALGVFQSNVQRFDDAVGSFLEAKNYEKQGEHRADLAIADLLFEQGRHEQALGFYENVEKVTTNRTMQLKLAECLVKLDRFDEAHERINRLESESGVDSLSLILKSSLADREADAMFAANRPQDAAVKLAEQAAILQMAEKIGPSDPMPHVMRASALFKEFQRSKDPVHLDNALVSLGRADEVRPRYNRTAMIRVAVLQAKGNTRGAINELSALVEREPTLVKARQLLVQFLVRSNQINEAIEVATYAVKANPTAVLWRVGLGDLYNSLLEDARTELAAAPAGSRAERTLRREVAELESKVDAEYAAAVALVPNEGLLIKRTAALLATDPPRYSDVMSVLEAHRERFETSPLLRMLYGEALGKSGFTERMQEQMRLAYHQQRKLITDGVSEPGTITRWYLGMLDIFGSAGVPDVEKLAHELSGGSPDSYELLAMAGLWRTRGVDGMSRAVELLLRAIEIAPAEDERLHAKLYSDLGTYYVLVQQFEEARAAFEKVLTLTPDNPEVLNNLAYLLSEKMTKPKEALTYALRAAELLPDRWSVLDTVGWIYFRIGDLEEADRWLRRSEEAEPTATNRYHLAEVFAARKDYTRARRFLREAAELGPDPQTLADINRLADDIRTKN